MIFAKKFFVLSSEDIYLIIMKEKDKRKLDMNVSAVYANNIAQSFLKSGHLSGWGGTSPSLNTSRSLPNYSIHWFLAEVRSVAISATSEI